MSYCINANHKVNLPSTTLTQLHLLAIATAEAFNRSMLKAKPIPE